MSITADPRPPRLDWREALLFLLLPLMIWVGAIRTGLADEPRTLAVALVCPGSLPGPDCSRETALDVIAQPAGASDCPKVAMLLATHLDLPKGGYHKLVCERRRG